MVDKTIRIDEPEIEEVPEDPSFEEMEELLREIEYFNDLTETLLLLELRPFRF